MNVPRMLRVGAALISTVVVLSACGGAAEPTPTKPALQTAAAPSATAATAATAVPAPAPKALILVGDTVRGTAGLTDAQKTYLTCTEQNRFPQGSSIVWRFKVVDPTTAKTMTAKELKSFVLTLPDGKQKPFNWGEHPKNSNVWFWTASFELPKDYPTGAFNYKVVATDLEGRTGMFDQFPVAAGMLQVVPLGKP
ncbi:MAG: hypothetical protein KGJ98_12390 [Chloroflexota bacterium]|nr:hypothetical protein [Chloroflexota bacterium]